MWYLSIYLLDLLQSAWNAAARIISLLPHQTSCTHLISTTMELDAHCAHAPVRGIVHPSSPLWYRATSLHSMVSSWFSLFPKYLAWSSSLCFMESWQPPGCPEPPYQDRLEGPVNVFLQVAEQSREMKLYFDVLVFFLTFFFSLKKLYLVFFQLMKRLFHGRKKKRKEKVLSTFQLYTLLVLLLGRNFHSSLTWGQFFPWKLPMPAITWVVHLRLLIPLDFSENSRKWLNKGFCMFTPLTENTQRYKPFWPGQSHVYLHCLRTWSGLCEADISLFFSQLWSNFFLSQPTLQACSLLLTLLC